jgi:integrase
MKLTDRFLKNVKPDDKPVTDDAVPGLIFTPTRKGGGQWSLRYVSPVRKLRTEMGLSTYPLVTLEKARERAQDARRMIDAGKDPVEERKRQRAEVVRAAGVPTLEQAAEKTYERERHAWKKTDVRNAKRWLASVRQHLKPLLDRRVDTLLPADFSNALAKAWVEHPRVAADVLKRAELTMGWAFAAGYIPVNPVPSAKTLLPKVKVATQHHSALPHEDAPQFVRDHLSGIAPHEVIRAAAFVLLHTAVRPGEVRGMQWGELDLDRGVWLIPNVRMKGKLDHDVPLVPEVVALLRAISKAKLHDTFVFPNAYARGPLTDPSLSQYFQETGAASDTPGRTPTPHGCRATFRGWCDARGYDERIAERQLAHRPRGHTAQAYQRDTMFARRARLLEQWTNYLHGRAADSNVLPLNVNAAA